MDNIEFTKKNLGKECRINNSDNKGMIIGYTIDGCIIIGFYDYYINAWKTNPYTDSCKEDNFIIKSPMFKYYYYCIRIFDIEIL